MRDARATPEGWASTVRSLQALYSVVAGAALGLAVNGFVDPSGESIIPTRSLPTIFALVITIVPFYHGSLRHFESVYVERPASGETERSLRLVLDFFLLFFEGCVLVAAAKLVQNSIAFTVALAILCLLDAVWGYTGLVVSKKEWVSTTWAKINTAGSLGFAALVWFQLAVRPPGWVLPVLVLTAAIVRTTVDYWKSWNFYFPPSERSESKDDHKASSFAGPARREGDNS
jgi:hypothetical protein